MITKLFSENFKRVRAVTIEPGGAGAVAVEEVVCETTENAMRKIADAARELLSVTGEIDDDGEFQACPQSSLTGTDRRAIAPWVEDQWRSLSALVGCTGMQTIVCRGCGGDGKTAQDEPRRCSVCGGSGVEVKL